MSRGGKALASLINIGCLDLDGVELGLDALDGALDGEVDLAGAVLDDEAGDQALVELGLELDVLGASELLELLGNDQLLLLLELDGRADGGHLRNQTKGLSGHT